MAWCHQATSHYLSQCWSRSMFPSLGHTELTYCTVSLLLSSPSKLRMDFTYLCHVRAKVWYENTYKYLCFPQQFSLNMCKRVDCCFRLFQKQISFQILVRCSWWTHCTYVVGFIDHNINWLINAPSSKICITWWQKSYLLLSSMLLCVTNQLDLWFFSSKFEKETNFIIFVAFMRLHHRENSWHIPTTMTCLPCMNH